MPFDLSKQSTCAPTLYPVIARFSRNATAEPIRKITEATNAAAQAIDAP